MTTRWLDDAQLTAWVRLAAVLELLPGVLDTQLRRDAELTHYEYYVMAMLSEAPKRTLRMTALAQRTNATLPRLSHVVKRLEDRDLIERFPCPEDARATNARLTADRLEEDPRDRTGPCRHRPRTRHRRPHPRPDHPTQPRSPPPSSTR